jgi:hypothetical protein
VVRAGRTPNPQGARSDERGWDLQLGLGTQGEVNLKEPLVELRVVGTLITAKSGSTDCVIDLDRLEGVHQDLGLAPKHVVEEIASVVAIGPFPGSIEGGPRLEGRYTRPQNWRLSSLDVKDQRVALDRRIRRGAASAVSQRTLIVTQQCPG